MGHKILEWKDQAGTNMSRKQPWSSHGMHVSKSHADTAVGPTAPRASAQSSQILPCHSSHVVGLFVAFRLICTWLCFPFVLLSNWFNLNVCLFFTLTLSLWACLLVSVDVVFWASVIQRAAAGPVLPPKNIKTAPKLASFVCAVKIQVLYQSKN